MAGPPYQMQEIIARVREQLGDLGTPFQDSFGGTGELSRYDLSESAIATLTVTAVQDGAVTTLVPGRDYDLEQVEGSILLHGSYSPLPEGMTLIAAGTAQGMLSDDELTTHIHEAVLMHCKDRRVTTRLRDSNGFIQYVETPLSLASLPEIELLPLVLLATINALWALATDASTDIDITTVEGTDVPRSQRFAQLMTIIDSTQARYEDYCQQLNIGFKRIEMSDLRRVSRTTGRLVPLYKDREYDDYSLPQRLIPEVDHRDDDTSDIPDPGYGGGYW